MKKIIIIGRPYSNGGDFLIYDRVVKVLKTVKPEASITLNLKNDNRFDVEELNRYDAIITGGGGAQFSEQYVETSFLYQRFEEITVPIHYMGTGLYGPDGTDATVYGSQYSEKMIAYFNKVLERGGQLATRDWTVDTIFRNNGIHNTVMTGCPAWYDLETLRESETGIISKPSFRGKDIRIIAISNHGLTKNAEDHEKKLRQMKSLIVFLQERFSSAKFMLTFNDGYMTKYSKNYNLSLKEWAESQNIDCVELSGDADKFRALDQIDLHIGFRVHTHIYCISKRIPSLLIEEDIRGYGMNETFHLPHITAYAQDSAPEDFRSNPFLNEQLAILLAQTDRQGRIDYDEVFEIIRDCYHTGMQRWLNGIFVC